MENKTDFEIIASILNGRRNDFGILIRRYREKAFCLLRRMLRNTPDAEDALQEAFIKAFIALPTFRQDAKFSTWFYRIVYTTALNKLKKSRPGALPKESPETISDDTQPADSYGKEILEKLIAKLDPDSIAILQLYYYDGLSCKEIAEITKLSVSNVKTLLHRSRITLKKLIEKHHLQGELQ